MICGTRLALTIDKTVSLADQHTQPTGDLVCFARDEEIDPIMLAAEFLVEFILEEAESNILMAGDGNGCRLVFGCMHLDVVFQRVVVDVIYGWIADDQRGVETRAAGAGSIAKTRTAPWYDLRRLHCGADSLSNTSPYFITLPRPIGSAGCLLSRSRERGGDPMGDDEIERLARNLEVWIRFPLWAAEGSKDQWQGCRLRYT